MCAPGGHILLHIEIECRAGNADKDEDHSEVHYVAAVAARVAHRELAHGGEDIYAAARRDHARAAPEFGKDREHDEYRKDQANERIDQPKTER